MSLIDDDEEGAGVPHADKGETKALTEMSEIELFVLREEINQLLPPANIQSINLEEELVRQFQVTRALQTKTLNSYEEAQKKATVLNACSASLQNLVKMQAEYFSAERLKEIESRLIRALERVPPEYLRDFFEWYESEMSQGIGN